MSWTRDQVRVLINEYKKHPCLYIVKSKQYLNKRMRLNALNAIKDAFHLEGLDVSITDIKTKFAGLKSTFYAEYKKYKQSISSGAGEDEVYEPSLWYFKELVFLLDHNEPRKSMDSISIQLEENIQSSDEVITEELVSDSYNVQDRSNTTICSVYTVTDTGVLEEAPAMEYEGEGIPGTSKGSSGSSSSSAPGTYRGGSGSSSSSAQEHYRTAPKPKKNKKVEVDAEDCIIKQATATLNKLASSIEAHDKNIIGEKDYVDDKAFGQYVVSRLSNIKNEQIRLVTEQKIIATLFEGIMNDIQSRN